MKFDNIITLQLKLITLLRDEIRTTPSHIEADLAKIFMGTHGT